MKDSRNIELKIEAKKRHDERKAQAGRYYEEKVNKALEAYHQSGDLKVYNKAVNEAQKTYKEIIREAKNKYDDIINPYKRALNISIGAFLVVIALTTWTLTVVGPKGPAHYDVNMDGRYYVEELVEGPPDGRQARIVLREISSAAVHRPSIESSFWRFWDSWGLLASIFAFFPIFAVGISRLMPALMRTDE